MNGFVHTCVMIAKAARGFLCRDGDPDRLGAGADVAAYAHSVVFNECEPSRTPSHELAANNPAAWLRHLQATIAHDAWGVHVSSGSLPVR